MKIHTVLFALSLSVAAVSCGKKSVPNPMDNRLYYGKILKNACGQIAIQVTDGSGIGERGWNDEGKVYNNVFSVANSCTWRPKNGTSEDICFRFVTPKPQNCYQCLMYVHVPETSFHIQVLE